MSKTKTKRKRLHLQKTAPSLRKLADKFFSIYIRQRGMDANGFNACFTCGVRKYWKELQCGHYVSRGYLSLRYNEGNCHPQCYGCNIGRKGNLDVYAIKLMDKYGDQTLRQLDELKYIYQKWGVMEYSKIISKYK